MPAPSKKPSAHTHQEIIPDPLSMPYTVQPSDAFCGMAVFNSEPQHPVHSNIFPLFPPILHGCGHGETKIIFSLSAAFPTI